MGKKKLKKAFIAGVMAATFSTDASKMKEAKEKVHPFIDVLFDNYLKVRALEKGMKKQCVDTIDTSTKAIPKPTSYMHYIAIYAETLIQLQDESERNSSSQAFLKYMDSSIDAYIHLPDDQDVIPVINPPCLNKLLPNDNKHLEKCFSRLITLKEDRNFLHPKAKKLARYMEDQMRKYNSELLAKLEVLPV